MALKTWRSMRQHSFASFFRSIDFIGMTSLLALFVYSALRRLHVHALSPCAREAIHGLIAIPILVWISSIFLQFEIWRSVAETESMPRHSRLRNYPQALVWGIVLMCYVIISQVDTACVPRANLLTHDSLMIQQGSTSEWVGRPSALPK